MCKVFKLGDKNSEEEEIEKYYFINFFCRNFIKYFQNFINFKIYKLFEMRFIKIYKVSTHTKIV